MRIRLLKKWDWVHQTFPRGQIIGVADPTAKKLIMNGIAEEYKGEYPPRTKMKTDLFKPKQ